MNCDILCPNNCRYQTCHIKNGTCFGCVSGYQGTFCKTGLFSPFLYFGKKNNGYYSYYFVNWLFGSVSAENDFKVTEVSLLPSVCVRWRLLFVFHKVNNLISKTSWPISIKTWYVECGFFKILHLYSWLLIPSNTNNHIVTMNKQGCTNIVFLMTRGAGMFV